MLPDTPTQFSAEIRPHKSDGLTVLSMRCLLRGPSFVYYSATVEPPGFAALHYPRQGRNRRGTGQGSVWLTVLELVAMWIQVLTHVK